MHLRLHGITDGRVLDALERIPREAFVPADLVDLAYEDRALPIGRGQTISQPLIVARMTQALGITERDKVLEIGTGSGYQAAVLSVLCRRLYTMERHRPLLQPAEQRFAHLGIGNITTLAGDGMKGWKQQAPFDGIIVTAGHRGPEPPQPLIDQLKIGGRIIIPLASTQGGEDLWCLTKLEDGTLSGEFLGGVRFVPLLPDLAKTDDPAQALG